MMAIPANELVNEEATTAVDLGRYANKPGLFPCTPMVKRAIEAVRSYQGSGDSVEKEGQVNRLNEYQSCLVEKLQEDYLSQTPDVFAALLAIRQAQALVKKASDDLDNMSASVKQAEISVETLKQTLTQASNQATSTDGFKNKLEQNMLSALRELSTANSLKKTADESASTLFHIISDATLIPIANFFRNILRLPRHLLTRMFL
jgi:chromosome segregation ATPase